MYLRDKSEFTVLISIGSTLMSMCDCLYIQNHAESTGQITAMIDQSMIDLSSSGQGWVMLFSVVLELFLHMLFFLHCTLFRCLTIG